METVSSNFYFADSQKQQKAKTFLMLSTVVSVTTICHGNHAIASAWKPETIRRTAQAK
jgi:hypothetical protein